MQSGEPKPLTRNASLTAELSRSTDPAGTSAITERRTGNRRNHPQSCERLRAHLSAQDPLRGRAQGTRSRSRRASTSGSGEDVTDAVRRFLVHQVDRHPDSVNLRDDVSGPPPQKWVTNGEQRRPERVHRLTQRLNAEPRGRLETTAATLCVLPLDQRVRCLGVHHRNDDAICSGPATAAACLRSPN